jgi:transposase
MIGSTRALRVFACAAPCDMRKAYEGLGAIVRNELSHDILSGELYLFTNARRTRAKVLLFDGTGLAIYMNQPSSYCTSFGSRNVSCALAG